MDPAREWRQRGVATAFTSVFTMTTHVVPRRIDVPERIPQDIRVPVERLGIPRAGHNRIRAEEASQRGSLESRAIVIQRAERGLFAALAGEAIVGW
jgi:hypothetical protein